MLFHHTERMAKENYDKFMTINCLNYTYTYKCQVYPKYINEFKEDCELALRPLIEKRNEIRDFKNKNHYQCLLDVCNHIVQFRYEHHEKKYNEMVKKISWFKHTTYNCIENNDYDYLTNTYKELIMHMIKILQECVVEYWKHKWKKCKGSILSKADKFCKKTLDHYLKLLRTRKKKYKNMTNVSPRDIPNNILYTLSSVYIYNLLQKVFNYDIPERNKQIISQKQSLESMSEEIYYTIFNGVIFHIMMRHELVVQTLIYKNNTNHPNTRPPIPNFDMDIDVMMKKYKYFKFYPGAINMNNQPTDYMGMNLGFVCTNIDSHQGGPTIHIGGPAIHIRAYPKKIMSCSDTPWIEFNVPLVDESMLSLVSNVTHRNNYSHVTYNNDDDDINAEYKWLINKSKNIQKRIIKDTYTDIMENITSPWKGEYLKTNKTSLCVRTSNRLLRKRKYVNDKEGEDEDKKIKQEEYDDNDNTKNVQRICSILRIDRNIYDICSPDYRTRACHMNTKWGLNVGVCENVMNHGQLLGPDDSYNGSTGYHIADTRTKKYRYKMGIKGLNREYAQQANGTMLIFMRHLIRPHILSLTNLKEVKYNTVPTIKRHTHSQSFKDTIILLNYMSRKNNDDDKKEREFTSISKGRIIRQSEYSDTDEAAQLCLGLGILKGPAINTLTGDIMKVNYFVNHFNHKKCKRLMFDSDFIYFELAQIILRLCERCIKTDIILYFIKKIGTFYRNEIPDTYKVIKDDEYLGITSEGAISARLLEYITGYSSVQQMVYENNGEDMNISYSDDEIPSNNNNNNIKDNEYSPIDGEGFYQKSCLNLNRLPQSAFLSITEAKLFNQINTINIDAIVHNISTVNVQYNVKSSHFVNLIKLYTTESINVQKDLSLKLSKKNMM